MLTRKDCDILFQENFDSMPAFGEMNEDAVKAVSGAAETVYQAYNELAMSLLQANHKVVSATTAASTEALMAVIGSGIKLQREFCQLLQEEEPHIALEIMNVKMEKFEVEQTSTKRVVVA